MVIKIKYHNGVMPIEKIHNGDWIDLRCAEDVFLEVGEYKRISLGVSMKLPAGYEAHVLPRSSTFEKYGVIVVNSEGIIDNSYSGDNDVWGFPALCLSARCFRDGKAGTFIPKNERVAQFRIRAVQPMIAFDEVEFMEDEDRGGFGSTGRM